MYVHKPAFQFLMHMCNLIGEDRQLHKERLQQRREDENNQLKEKHPGGNQ